MSAPKDKIKYEKWRKGISRTLKGRIPWNKGLKGWNKGHPDWTPPEARKKQGKTIRGKNNPNWKGGKQRGKHKGNWRYTEWRSKVFKRDNWICQTCGIRSKAGEPVYLEAHHIKSWAKYPKLRYKVGNGITLCKECHKIIHKRKR